MSKTATCTSPIDGSVYLERPVLIPGAANVAATLARNAQPGWAARPLSERIALMNDISFGLTASIWTSDAAKADEIGARLQTGTVFMNRCDYLDPGLCWTGCKDTGRGADLSVLGFHALTRPKSYHLKKG